MRKSKKQEKRQKRNNLIAALVMLFLMVGSVVAFAISGMFSSPGEKVEYNGFVFEPRVVFSEIFNQDIQKVFTKINGEEVSFYFLPYDVNAVVDNTTNLGSLNKAEILLFTRAPLSAGSQPDLNLVFFDLLMFELNQGINKPVFKGVLNESIYEETEVQITCEDASLETPVFVYHVNDRELGFLEVEPFCYEVSAQGDYMLLLADYLKYKFFNII